MHDVCELRGAVMWMCMCLHTKNTSNPRLNAGENSSDRSRSERHRQCCHVRVCVVCVVCVCRE